MTRWRRSSPAARVACSRVGVVASLNALVLVLTYYVTVLTVPGRRVGDASLRGAALVGSAFRAGVDAVLDAVSVGALLAATAAVAVIALLRLERTRGLAAIGILVGSNLSTWALKDVLLVRPDLGLREVAPATLNSLPSGHSTAAFSVVAAVLFVAPAQWRPSLSLLGGGYSALTAFATMSAGWHRAGDSVAAFATVGFWTCIASVAVVLLKDPPVSAVPVSSPGSPVVRWLAAGSAGSWLVGSAVGVWLAMAPTVLESTFGRVTASAVGGMFIVGSVTAALVGILVVTGLVDLPAGRTGAEVEGS